MRKIILIFLLISPGVRSQLKPTDAVICDSASQAYLEHLIIERINEFRVARGVPPLIVDTLLKPAVDHHVEYQRRAQVMSHDEDIDLPDFDELLWPGMRIRLLEPGKFWKITDELLSYLVEFHKPEARPFQYYVTATVDKGYKTCNGHWSDLMNPEYNAIYMCYDFQYADPCEEDARYRAIVCTIVLGTYSDPYKKELGMPVEEY